MPGQPWRNAIRESVCWRTDTTWEEKWRQYYVCFIFVKSCSWANHVRHDTAPLQNSQEYRDAIHIGFIVHSELSI